MRKDITGLKVGRLTVVRFLKNDNNDKAIWICKCSCGGTVNARTSDLIKGDYKSCGCRKKEGFNHIHGLCYHPLHNTWRAMKDRCYNPKNNRAKNYAGIKICKSWLTFATFYKWAIKNEWKKGLQIHRKNSAKDYSPGNCIFLTASAHSTITNNERWNRL